MFSWLSSKDEKEECAARLISAIRAKDCGAVNSLLQGPHKEHINLNDKNVYLYETVLHGTPAIMGTLLQAGAHPRTGLSEHTSRYEDQKRTPLRVAIEKDRLDMARVLLEDPRTEDPDYEPHITTSYHAPSVMGPSARQLAAQFNRSAEWNDAFDLCQAKRFAEKIEHHQSVLKKAGLPPIRFPGNQP